VGALGGALIGGAGREGGYQLRAVLPLAHAAVPEAVSR
jgi:two-component system sensor histidine kinase DesK